MKVQMAWLAAIAVAAAAAAAAQDATAPQAAAAGQDEPEVSEQEVEAHASDYEQDGKWFTAEDIPTYHVAEDGTVDWYTFSGFRRYHAECHTCHGPDGQGSSYAPAIAKSALRLDYYDFVDVVVNGRHNGNSVMPSFGTNQNVMCYLDDIYIYLKAVGSEAVPRGRPANRADKPEAYTEAENACMG